MKHYQKKKKRKREPYEQQRARNYKRMYNLTLDEVQALIDKQGGKCAICQQSRVLVVDHDHKSGKVRGMLCGTCNTGIGKLGDSADGLRQALIYLTRN